MFNTILHASVIVHDLPTSLNFYCDTLGFETDISRPALGYPGAWLWVGEQQIHLLQVPNPDPTENRPEHGGRDRHVAIGVNDIKQLEARLVLHSIRFTKSKSGRAALFIRDPDGNALEFIQQVEIL